VILLSIHQSDVLTDPQGLKVSIERPCKHPSWRWA
jgi:hypothetical protein